MKKKKIVCAVIILVVVILAGILIYAACQKKSLAVLNHIEYDFFHGDTEKADFGLLDHNGQSYTIDDYTITLDRTLYDADTGIGYCVFAITNENKIPECTEEQWCFGEDDRFYIDIEASGSQTKSFETKKNILYEYISFDVDGEYNNTICLTDYKTRDDNAPSEYKTYSYTIKNQSKSKTYDMDDHTRLIISPLGIRIDAESVIADHVITLYYKNGESRTVVDTKKSIGIGSSSECNENGEYICYQFIFYEDVNLDDVDYVVYNDNK